MSRERGNNKWASLMLPEHRELLENWFQQPSAEEWVERRIDEQQLEEMDQHIRWSMQTKKPLHVTYRTPAGFRSLTGTVAACDEVQGILRIYLDSGEQIRLSRIRIVRIVAP